MSTRIELVIANIAVSLILTRERDIDNVGALLYKLLIELNANDFPELLLLVEPLVLQLVQVPLEVPQDRNRLVGVAPYHFLYLRNLLQLALLYRFCSINNECFLKSICN